MRSKRGLIFVVTVAAMSRISTKRLIFILFLIQRRSSFQEVKS